MASPYPAHSRREYRTTWTWLVAVVATASVAVAVITLQYRTEANGSAAPTAPAPTLSPTAAPELDPAPEPEPEPPQPVQFTLVAAGDVLTHMPVLNSARAAGGGDYDFAALMQNIRPYVDGADLAICHLEVPVAPAGSQPSGYPMFGAPPSLVPALADEGWDGCTTASNHTVDRGFPGVVATLEALDAVGLGHAGSARSEDEAAQTQLYAVRDGSRVITVANISFTYGLNGLPMPQGAPWAVNVFDADNADVEPILDAASAAREAGADVVVASVHCCTEYRIEPTDAQRSIVAQIGDSGLVDLYIGHHAHVPQPIALVDGGPAGRGMWAAYGLGNYLSNQDTQCCVADTNSGVVLTATVTVGVDGEVDVGVEWTAVTVDRLDSHTMHVLADITDTGTGRLSAAEAAARLQRVSDAVGDEAPERTQPPARLADGTAASLRWWNPDS